MAAARSSLPVEQAYAGSAQTLRLHPPDSGQTLRQKIVTSKEFSAKGSVKGGALQYEKAKTNFQKIGASGGDPKTRPALQPATKNTCSPGTSERDATEGQAVGGGMGGNLYENGFRVQVGVKAMARGKAVQRKQDHERCHEKYEYDY